jgi:hypothetical protein
MVVVTTWLLLLQRSKPSVQGSEAQGHMPLLQPFIQHISASRAPKIQGQAFSTFFV